MTASLRPCGVRSQRGSPVNPQLRVRTESRPRLSEGDATRVSARARLPCRLRPGPGGEVRTPGGRGRGVEEIRNAEAADAAAAAAELDCGLGLYRTRAEEGGPGRRRRRSHRRHRRSWAWSPSGGVLQPGRTRGGFRSERADDGPLLRGSERQALLRTGTDGGWPSLPFTVVAETLRYVRNDSCGFYCVRGAPIPPRGVPGVRNL